MHLLPRDREIVWDLYVCRAILLSDIAERYFSHYNTAQRRIKQLVKWGYLKSENYAAIRGNDERFLYNGKVLSLTTQGLNHIQDQMDYYQRPIKLDDPGRKYRSTTIGTHVTMAKVYLKQKEVLEEFNSEILANFQASFRLSGEEKYQLNTTAFLWIDPTYETEDDHIAEGIPIYVNRTFEIRHIPQYIKNYRTKNKLEQEQEIQIHKVCFIVGENWVDTLIRLNSVNGFGSDEIFVMSVEDAAWGMIESVTTGRVERLKNILLQVDKKGSIRQAATNFYWIFTDGEGEEFYIEDLSSGNLEAFKRIKNYDTYQWSTSGEERNLVVLVRNEEQQNAYLSLMGEQPHVIYIKIEGV